MTTADVHHRVAGRLANAGQRYTARRRAVVEVLASADRPLTVPQILEAHGALAQSSAYRNVAVLEEAGVVHRIVTTDEFARFELDEGLTHDHHHHLVCAGCGEVVDFTVPSDLERRIDRDLGRVAGRSGFRVERHRLDLVGRCADCA